MSDPKAPHPSSSEPSQDPEVVMSRNAGEWTHLAQAFALGTGVNTSGAERFNHLVTFLLGGREVSRDWVQGAASARDAFKKARHPEHYLYSRVYAYDLDEEMFGDSEPIRPVADGRTFEIQRHNRALFQIIMDDSTHPGVDPPRD